MLKVRGTSVAGAPALVRVVSTHFDHVGVEAIYLSIYRSIYLHIYIKRDIHTLCMSHKYVYIHIYIYIYI